MGKGSSGTNTVVQNQQPPQQILDQYQNVIARANSVAQTPYSSGGFNASNLVAGFTPSQLQSFDTVNSAQGLTAPYYNKAQGYLDNSQAPLWSSTAHYSPEAMSQYMNPYTDQVVNSTLAQINNQDAQQQQGVIGNAISRGAWGGDRAGIAQAALAGQQDLARNSTIANLYNSGFNQQQQEFNTQQQAQLGANEANAWLGTQGAALETGLGNAAQTSTLNAATAQNTIGNQQQAQAQSVLNIPYQQYLAEQAYPFQTTSWLSNISTGVGGSSGGNSSTTSPAPSTLSQGLGTAASLGTLGYLGYLALSDMRMKDHIERAGTIHGEHGDYPSYTFQYKGDDASHYGVMAQEVEKKNPKAVHERDGYKYVDYSKLARGGFVPHFDSGGGVGGFVPSGYLTGKPPSVGPMGIDISSLQRGSMGPPRAPDEYHAPGTGGGMSSLASVLAATPKLPASATASSLNGPDLSDASMASAVAPGLSDPMSTAGLGPNGTFGYDLNGMATGTTGWGFAKGGFIPHYDDGGAVGGLTPAMTNSNPVLGNAYAQYDSMSLEQLQQLAARAGGSPEGTAIRAALQKKQMTGGMPTMAKISGMARGGFARHYADGGSDEEMSGPLSADDAAAGPSNDAKFLDLFGGGQDPTSTLPPLPSVNVPATPDAPRGFSPSAVADIPDHDAWMKDYTDKVANAQPYNKPDPILALLATASAIGAGRSPYFGVNAGAGAMEGIHNYAEQKKQAASESEHRGTLQEQGENLYENIIKSRHQMSQDNERLQQDAERIQETSRHNQADEKLRGQQMQQDKYTMSPYGQVLNTRTGEVTGKSSSDLPDYIFSPGPDGKAVAGPAAMHRLKQADPQLALATQMIIDGDKKMATTSMRADPVWKQATLTARAIDPTVSEERFTNKQKFMNSQDAKNIDTFNTIPSHLKVLEEAAHALDNGDSKTINTIKNTWKEQFGSDLPTNLNTARNMVSAEIVKAITGAGGVADRKDAQEQFDRASSDAQLTGAINMTKHLIGERINSAAYRYRQTVNGGNDVPGKDYYQLIRPEVRDYLGIGPKSENGAGPAPVVLSAPPSASSRIIGQSYNTPKGMMTWTKEGWTPSGGR